MTGIDWTAPDNNLLLLTFLKYNNLAPPGIPDSSNPSLARRALDWNQSGTGRDGTGQELLIILRSILARSIPNFLFNQWVLGRNENTGGRLIPIRDNSAAAAGWVLSAFHAWIKV
jgi:hypothetical protein